MREAPSPSDPNLINVVKIAITGDHDAFAELVRHFAPRLHRHLSAMGLSASDADDMVQDAFLRAWKNLAEYDERYAFSTWIYTIARRLALNHLARRRSQVSLDHPMHDPASTPISPEKVDEKAAAQNLWHRANALLPERYFTALWLRYAEERPLADIGRILGITAINARVLIHRARERLAEKLDPDDVI